jgi:hypothetical protein
MSEQKTRRVKIRQDEGREEARKEEGARQRFLLLLSYIGLHVYISYYVIYLKSFTYLLKEMDGVDALDYILNKNIPGDIVECGCGNGNYEVAWVRRLKERYALRHIYMFDTFAGLTEPSDKDFSVPDSSQYTMSADQVKNEWLQKKKTETENSWCNWSVEYVKGVLAPFQYPDEYMHYVVGDVQNTLLNKGNIPEKIAILRLDTDWYDSSKIELIKLFPKVVPGGVVIFDDYNHWNGQRQATDEYFKEIGESYTLVHLGKVAAFIKENPIIQSNTIQELFYQHGSINTLNGTDKSSTHSYGNVYETLFAQRKNIQNFLEIGISGGYGLLCYAQYFRQANIYGVDIADNIQANIRNHHRIKILIDDAHKDSVIEVLPMCDIIIEDASHEARDQILHFAKYSKLVNPGGVYIIEDVDQTNLQILLDVLSPFAALRGFQVSVYDGRQKKNRGDDILIVFEKQA